MLGAAPGSVARLCDQATEIGLLGPGRGVGEVYRFRHALIRETLYAELTPQSRAQAHRRIAEVLENKRRGSNAELAHHFLRAAPASTEAAERAVYHSRLAGQQALDALAYEEAAGHFRRALDVQRRAAHQPARRVVVGPEGQIGAATGDELSAQLTVALDAQRTQITVQPAEVESLESVS